MDFLRMHICYDLRQYVINYFRFSPNSSRLCYHAHLHCL